MDDLTDELFDYLYDNYPGFATWYDTLMPVQFGNMLDACSKIVTRHRRILLDHIKKEIDKPV